MTWPVHAIAIKPIRTTGCINIPSFNIAPNTSTAVAATKLYIAAVYVVDFFELAGVDADDVDEEEEEIGLIVVVIADVICITPSVSKQRKVEIHRSHFSEEGKARAWLLKTTCSILTPNAVKPIINGKWMYNHVI